MALCVLVPGTCYTYVVVTECALALTEVSLTLTS